jgi:Uma2 family endonuclease
LRNIAERNIIANMTDELRDFVEKNVDRLVHAAECELPALEGIVTQAEARFSDVFADETTRRRFGKVIAEVLRARGWEPARQARIRRGRSRYFATGTLYRRRDGEPPMSPEEPLSLESLMERADDAGIRLELVRGEHRWEAAPLARHQRAVQRAVASLRRPSTGCACFILTDTCVSLSPDTVKRPDIALWCREPANLDAFITELPDAVIDVISPGYEKKDHDSAALYLELGVRDVLTFDPRSGVIRIYDTPAQWTELRAPTSVTLRGCGCSVEL